MTKRATGNRQKKVVTARFARGGDRFPRPSNITERAAIRKAVEVLRDPACRLAERCR